MKTVTKIRKQLLRLTLGLLVIGTTSAQAAEVFGLTFGQPLPMPECERDKDGYYGYGWKTDRTCFRSDVYWNNLDISPVGWGKERTPTSTTLTPTITDRISSRAQSDGMIPSRIYGCVLARPIGGAIDVSVFHWVVMDVIDVAGQIIVIAYRMLPIPALPNATLSSGLSTF